jgi:hypothetical protein
MAHVVHSSGTDHDDFERATYDYHNDFHDVAGTNERQRGNGLPPGRIGAAFSRDSHSWVGREDDYVLMVTEADASDALEAMAHEGKSTALAWAWIACGSGFVLGLLFALTLALGFVPGAIALIMVWVAYMVLAIPYGVNSDFFGSSFDD